MCPDCPRNFRGVDIIDHYPLCEVSLEQFKKIFPMEFLKQITDFLINGNYGDFITAKDALGIVQYIKECNPRTQIRISTNASGQPKIWSDLAKTNAEVFFRLDGLKDTHHLYRQLTDWDLIIDNAKKFIASGGNAVWTMIVFSHNRHQIDACKELSTQLGFRKFRLIDNPEGTRNVFPVFTKDKKLSHIVGNYDQSVEWETVYGKYQESISRPESALRYVTEKQVQCKALSLGEIYVSANGEVSPCCWTGFYPHSNNTIYENVQLAAIAKNNNALIYGLEKSIEWFNEIEQSWSKDSVAQGKILCCNEVCGV